MHRSTAPPPVFEERKDSLSRVRSAGSPQSAIAQRPRSSSSPRPYTSFCHTQTAKGHFSIGKRTRQRQCSGSSASEVEFSKGYRYFASVIKLAKCGSAAKVGIRRVGIAVKTAHGARFPGPGARRPRGIAARTGPAPPPLSNETHWGRKPPIGVGNLPTPTPSCLPQCGNARHVAYPNALLPTPMREGAPRCLPQCTVTYPNAGARPPAALSAPRLLRAPLRIWAGVVQNASGFRCFRRAPRGSGPKCV